MLFDLYVEPVSNPTDYVKLAGYIRNVTNVLPEYQFYQGIYGKDKTQFEARVKFGTDRMREQKLC